MHPTPDHDPNRTALRLTVAVLVSLLLATALVSLAARGAPAGAAGLDGKIAFASDRDGDLDIYTVEPTGSGRVNLTPGSPGRDTHPVWSRDSRIAFTSDRDGDLDIYVMNADGTNVQQITNAPGNDARPTWSPDGTRLVFRSDRAGAQHLFSVRLDLLGYPVAKLTNGTSNNGDPSWGPTGRIAFTSNRDGDRDIFVMDADGTEVVQVTENAVDDGNARWVSATRLVYQTKRTSSFDIVEIDTDGSHRTPIFDGLDEEMHPVRSPSGTQMAYTKSVGTARWLLVSDANGADPHGIQTDAGAMPEFPDWQSKPLVFRPRQRIENVVVQPGGTRAVVRFTTRMATDGAHVELWTGSTMRWAWDQGATTKNHELVVGFLQPNTAYTVKIFAPRVTAAGEATYVRSSPVRTLKRQLAFTYTHAYVDNDGDASTCGDVRIRAELNGWDAGGPLGLREICGGPWNFTDITVLYDDAPYDDMFVRFKAEEDDTIACGLGDDCFDRAVGSTSITLVDDAESFTNSGSVHLYPQGDHLEMTMFFTYSVTYHA